MELILFADDANIFISDKSLTNLNDKINFELRKVSIWFKLNKLSCNVKKTTFMIFTNNKFKNEVSHLRSILMVSMLSK